MIDAPPPESRLDLIITRMGADILGLLALLLLLSLFPWDWLGTEPIKVQNAIALVSSVATLLAVAVALWSAAGTERLRRSQERTMANLAAAEVSVTLRATLNRFGRLVGSMRFESEGDPRLENEVGRTLEVFREPLDPPAMEVLRLLAPLPNNCAGRIARAYRELHYIKQSVEKKANRLLAVGVDRDTRRHRLDEWANGLEYAIEMLSLADKECAKAADAGAPVPSDEERFGDGSYEN